MQALGDGEGGGEERRRRMRRAWRFRG